MKQKPRLSSGKRIILNEGTVIAAPHAVKPTTIATGSRKEPLPLMVLRHGMAYTLVVGVVLVAVYMALSTSVFFALGVDSKPVGVLRNTFPVGQAPAHAVVAVVPGDKEDGFVGRVKESVGLVPSPAIAQIIGGPVGDVKTNKAGYVVFNGSVTQYKATVPSARLKDQYIAVCLGGNCELGEVITVNTNGILGEVKGSITVTGIKPYKVSQ